LKPWNGEHDQLEPGHLLDRICRRVRTESGHDIAQSLRPTTSAQDNLMSCLNGTPGDGLRYSTGSNKTNLHFDTSAAT
jgi:hypothetical protein